MTPPGGGGPGGGAAAPPLSPTSPQTLAAAAGAPMSAPPPLGGPAPAPAGPPPAAPSPVSPYSDLPADLPHHYQLLDVADRQLKQAIATGGFYKEPEVLAGLRHLESDLSKIISTYARGNKGAPMEAPAIQTGIEDDEGDTAPAVPIGDDDDTGDIE